MMLFYENFVRMLFSNIKLDFIKHEMSSLQVLAVTREKNIFRSYHLKSIKKYFGYLKNNLGTIALFILYF
jgi:hypothetical protein